MLIYSTPNAKVKVEICLHFKQIINSFGFLPICKIFLWQKQRFSLFLLLISE